MALIKWNNNADPFEEMFNLDKPLWGFPVLPRAGRLFSAMRDNWTPALDINEDEDSITVKADIPGLKKEEIDVSIDNGVLTIRGERKSEQEKKNRNVHRVERFYGVFERRVDLGTAVDEAKVRANYTNGVLELVLPKSQAAQPRRIAIN